MTEASHQMASNPLPARAAPTRHGSVAPPASASAPWTIKADPCSWRARPGEVVIQGAGT